jgi:hypothetical protein
MLEHVNRRFCPTPAILADGCRPESISGGPSVYQGRGSMVMVPKPGQSCRYLTGNGIRDQTLDSSGMLRHDQGGC